MPTKQPKINSDDPTIELLRDLLIVQLVKAGVPQRNIREIVHCDLNRVSRTAKHLNKAGSRTNS